MSEIEQSTVKSGASPVTPRWGRRIINHPSLRFALVMIGGVWLSMFVLQDLRFSHTTSGAGVIVVPASRPGDPQRLAIEMRIPSSEIDNVREGQTAKVRLNSQDRAKTLNATVTFLGRDLERDSDNAPSYFPAQLTFSPSEHNLLQQWQLLPGTKVDVQIVGPPSSLLTRLWPPSSFIGPFPRER